MNTNNDKLRNCIQVSLDTIKKLSKPEYKDIQSKLEFVIGSYDYDKNPVGLYEFGEKALDLLRNEKANQPRKVNKKIITDLEKTLNLKV